MLRQGGCFSLSELATSFGVCERTVQRDLLLLKKAGIDIRYDACTKTFRIISLAEASPPRSVRSEHVRLLATAARSSSLYASPHGRSAIEAAIAGLLSSDPASNDSAPVESRTATRDAISVSAPRSVLAELGRPLPQRRGLRIKFEDARTGWEWRLTVVPLQLSVVGEKLALLVKSPPTATLFLIDLERILSASLTEETYEVEAPSEDEIVDARRLF
jgi:predicted DNA-binding transcriptional regulator YafY